MLIRRASLHYEQIYSILLSRISKFAQLTNHKYMRSIFLFLFFVSTLSMLGQYQTDMDVQYTSKTDGYSVERCKLDIYYPMKTSGMPVVIWFHGGGLTGGQKSIPDGLKDAGFIVVAPNYRLIPNVKIDDCIDDAAEAVAWVFNNIKEYGGDSSKIFVSGHSAGGYLTSMIGLDKKWLKNYEIDADSIAGLIPYSGQAITHFAHRRINNIPELQPTVDEYAPLFHIRKEAPPYIIITGDEDLELYGRYEENLYLWRMLKLVGHPDVQIFKLDGHNHGDMVSPAHHILKQQIKRLIQ